MNLALVLTLLGAGTGASLQGLAPVPAPPSLEEVDRRLLLVTLGQVFPMAAVCPEEQRQRCSGLMLGTPSGEMRAVARGSKGDVAALDFIYFGPSTKKAPLASGELRQQIGLKLRAKDSCNVLYVMWRIGTNRPGIVVSLKRNEGKHSHAECGPRGYQTIRAEQSVRLPPLVPGERHRFLARIEGERLRVEVDGVKAWEGEIGPAIRSFDGPIGIRTDNGRFAFSLQMAK